MNLYFFRCALVGLCLATVTGVSPAQNAAAAAKAPPKVDLILEDQFETKHNVTDYKGSVLILVYGDRSGMDASRELGSSLHVLFHPTAAGKTPKEARTAPVEALDGVAKDRASPDVVVVPVATATGVPGPIQGLIRKGMAKNAPETPVWLDFQGVMSEKFGLREGEPNIALIDGNGCLRLKVNGKPNKETLQKVLQTAQNLRAEIAGLK